MFANSENYILLGNLNNEFFCFQIYIEIKYKVDSEFLRIENLCLHIFGRDARGTWEAKQEIPSLSIAWRHERELRGTET